MSLSDVKKVIKHAKNKLVYLLLPVYNCTNFLPIYSIGGHAKYENS